MIQDFLNDPIFVIALTSLLGLFVSKITFKGIGLGSSAVIFVSILFGLIGCCEVPQTITQLGMAMFLFSIGVQAGPSFFSTIRQQGVLIFGLSCVIISVGFLTAMGCLEIFGLDKNLVLGITNGALTTTPGLAAAMESVDNPLIAIGYSLAYPFGLIGVIIFVNLLPKACGKTLEGEEALLKKGKVSAYKRIVSKSFVVENEELVGKTPAETSFDETLDVEIICIHHKNKNKNDDENEDVAAFQLGDVIKVAGIQHDVNKVGKIVGPEVETEEDDENEDISINQFILTNKRTCNRKLGELNLDNLFGAKIALVRRNTLKLKPYPEMRLQFGDKILMAYKTKYKKAISDLLGQKPHFIVDDFIVLFFGILFGFFLGKISISFYEGVNVTLGFSVGTIVSGITLGAIGKTGPIVWQLSTSFNRVIKEYGLIIFFAAVGTSAGAAVNRINISISALDFLCGVFVTLMPMFVTVLLIYVWNRHNLLQVIGIITGGMTSIASLASIMTRTSSNVPATFCALVYPIALIFNVIWVKIYVLLFY